MALLYLVNFHQMRSRRSLLTKRWSIWHLLVPGAPAAGCTFVEAVDGSPVAPFGLIQQSLPIWQPLGKGISLQSRQGGFKVRAGDNTIRLGIAAVRHRLEHGTLRVLEGACPNLLAEAGLYHYHPERKGEQSENPVDEYNHALGALRYMISKLDAGLMAKMRRPGSEKLLPPDAHCPLFKAPR